MTGALENVSDCRAGDIENSDCARDRRALSKMSRLDAGICRPAGRSEYQSRVHVSRSLALSSPSLPVQVHGSVAVTVAPGTGSASVPPADTLHSLDVPRMWLLGVVVLVAASLFTDFFYFAAALSA